MTDRELLELAAKAAGIEILAHADNRSPVIKAGVGKHLWNPLTDDGDALRLAVKLGLDLLITQCDDNCGETTAMGTCMQEDDQYYGVHEVEQHYDSDPYAATRRAITRAAAMIGKDME